MTVDTFAAAHFGHRWGRRGSTVVCLDCQPVQKACEGCSQGVMDADGPAGPGNDHLYGRCTHECHRVGA